MLQDVKVIGFDADDTLWINEPYFREGEEKFFDLMEVYLPRHSTARELLSREIENLPTYGYGIKAFVLSMLETALQIGGNTLPLDTIQKIIDIGRRLESYFHHIEIVSEKRMSDYQKLLRHLDIPPSEFVMIGNSLKSDILPVLEMGSYGIHVPFHTTWEHEKVDVIITDPTFRQVEHLSHILPFFENVHDH